MEKKEERKKEEKKEEESWSSSPFSWRHRLAYEYEVFLSFRGYDTRYGFTGHLYKSLSDKGIRTFIDDKDLPRGNQITPSLVKAIQDSRISIIVFSQNYASSSFCLDELVNIVAYIKDRGRLVLPVFYDVDPSHVRHHTGCYEDAFAKHEERFMDDKEKLQTWRMALRQVADLSGYHFRKDGSENEYEFIRKIVKEVSNKINRTYLHVADYPVGLESPMLQVLSLLDDGSDGYGVHMVGIHGIGGIGKTTVARAIYNLIADQFEGLCFLDKVRENSIKHGLEHLQETLLSKTIGENGIKLGSVNEGIPIIKHRLGLKKVLLVLDDVDELDQLRAIAGGIDWFGSGSRVIITTRDKHLLTCHGVKSTYEVDGLSKEDALKLLNWNAFKTSIVNPSYMNVLNRVVTYAFGLPLALEVIGSNLYGKRIKQWESALDQYERIPNRKIQEILKVSFDSLEEDEKKIFLDIACCFQGYALTYVKEILSSHHSFCPEYAIQVLIDRSLIKINADGHVTLHDLIEDMGKEIVRLESPGEPGNRSRLWFHEDIVHVLEENMGTSRIEIIILDYLKCERVEWDGDAFKQMKNLKTLIIRKGCFSKGPEHLPNGLRVLEWWGYPSPSLPSDFDPKKLIMLDLPESRLMSFESILSKKKFVNMRVLKLDYCQFITEIFDVSGVPNLKELSFKDCKKLTKIHGSIGLLDKLEIMNADGCSKLRCFPPFKLTSLKELRLSYCESLQTFPEILVKMDKIVLLDIVGTPIKELPFSIKNLNGLKKLVLMDCGIVQLPSSILVMHELHELIAGAYTTLLLPKQDEGVAPVSSMVFENTIHLGLSDCNISDEFLRIGLPLFANVNELYLSWNDFTILPACIKECRFLKTIYLDDCYNLREIRGVPPNLVVFSAKNCRFLIGLDLTLLPACTEECRFLRRLILDGCKNLREIRGIPSNIRTLSARNCPSLTSECRSMLLNQELHKAGEEVKEFRLPGTRIPEWFDHRTIGSSISFWFRDKDLSISLCIVTGPSQYQDIITPRVTVNGKVVVPRVKFPRGKFFRLPAKVMDLMDHIFIFDLKSLIPKYKKDIIFGNKWNLVHCTIIGHPNKLFIKQSGIHVFKQESNMEDIQFIHPREPGSIDMEDDMNLKTILDDQV